MRTFSMVLAMASCVGLAACAGDSGDSDTDSDTDTDTDTDSDTDVDKTYVLEGTVSDAEGAPIEGAAMFLCNYDICFQTTSEADGGYGFLNGKDAAYALKIKAEGYPVASTALVMGDGATARAMDITLPDYETNLATPSNMGFHELAPGVYVEFSSAGLDAPDSTDASKAGGSWVASDIRLPIDEMPSTGSVVGTWYLSPYDASAAGDGMPFKVDDAAGLGLADGDSVSLWVHSYDRFTSSGGLTSQWAPGGTATVQSGAIEGLKVPYIATVVMFKE